MSAPSTLMEAAVWYCEHGYGIIPIAPRGKRPVSRNGLNDWFDNPDDARKLWTEHPDLNIGIVCGVPSHGLVVLDVDEDDEKDRHGLDTLNEWEGLRGELPKTATAITGRGGLHYLYRTSRTNIRPSTNAELSVDVRADGSYIVAPPSIHPNGQPYRWDVGCAPWECGVADANGNVYDFLDHVQRNGGTSDDAPKAKLFELPDVIKRGERDDTLFRYACSLRSRGERDDVIQAMVEKANRDRCERALTQDAVDRIVRQACKHGPGQDGGGVFADEVPSIGAPGGGGGGEPRQRRKQGAPRHDLMAGVLLSENHARHIDGAPALWTGQRWEFGKRAFERACISMEASVKSDTRNEVFKYIQAMAPSVSSTNGFDGGYYVQFADGVTVDALSGQTVTPDPSMYIIGRVSTRYNPDAPPGAADDFISSLAGGDAATQTLLCEIVGACMCSMPATQQAVFLVGRASGPRGEASNGKSSFLKVVKTLLGADNVSSLDLETLGQRFQAANVVGKLANIGDDIPDGFLKNQELSAFKKLVDGSGLYTDVKNAEGFDFMPTATLVFSMNSIPRMADTTDGVFRRLCLTPFRQCFRPGQAGYDPHIVQKMCRPENLERLAMLGLMALPDLIGRYQFTILDDMAEEIETVRIDNNIVLRWWYDSQMTVEELDGKWTSDVYREFKEWAEDNGERYPSTQRNFTRELLSQVATQVATLATLATLEVVESRDRMAGKRGRRFKLNLRV